VLKSAGVDVIISGILGGMRRRSPPYHNRARFRDLLDFTPGSL
jgi:hypothetical protein